MPTVDASRRPRRWLLLATAVAYAVAIALIGFWPEHVDRGADGLIDALVGSVPFLTYGRLEFGMNVLLFVPFGVIVALLVTRPAVAIFAAFAGGLCVSALIENVQASFLPGPTGSTLDIVANTLGAVLGCVAVVLVRSASHRRRSTTS